MIRESKEDAELRWMRLKKKEEEEAKRKKDPKINFRIKKHTWRYTTGVFT